jgi:hypothetical protein
MAFPSNPINNQVAIVNNISFTYNAVKTAWVRTPPSSTVINVLNANVINSLQNITANNFSANGNITIGGAANLTFSTLTANNIVARNNFSILANTITANSITSNGNFIVTGNTILTGRVNFLLGDISANNITLSNNFTANSYTFVANGTIVFTANNVVVANNLTANNIFANNFLTIFANNTITISSNNNIFMNAANILVSNTITANILTANQISGNVILLETTNIGNNTIGYLGAPQKNITATSYTLVLTDAGKTIYLTQGANTGTVVIPTNATVPFPLGTTILLIMGASFSSNVTAANPPSLWVASNSVQRTAVTLGSYSMSSLIKVATDTWYISGAGAY